MKVNLEKYAQVISTEMMAALETSAEARGTDLDVEIALRLMVSLIEFERAEGNNLLSQILRKEFTQQEAIAECKRKREATLYLYEMKKLHLFLEFEAKLPRNIKEHFSLIDVKEATQRIKAELEAENKRASGE